jgi:hypothetical protein
MIHDEEQILKFINILPDLQNDEVYFLSASARNKYLTQEEREYYTLGRTEMFARKIAQSKSKYINVINNIIKETSIYHTKNNKNIPQKCLVYYANINPSSGVQALQLFYKKTNDLLFSMYSNPKHVGNFKNLNTLLMNCYQKAKSRKYFIDIDCDVEDQEYIEPIRYELRKNNVIFYTIQTRSGFHILIEKHSVKYNYTRIINTQNELVKQIGGEIIINQSEMIPIPGIFQAGAKVKFIDIPVNKLKTF